MLIRIIVPLDMQGTEEARNLQMPALDKTLLGCWLEGGIELVDQGLDDRLKQLAGGLEDQVAELVFEGQKLLVGRPLI